MDALVQGIYPDIPFDTYRSLPAISAHGLMLIERSPAHYRASLSTPRPSTPAQQLGTLTHLAVLEWDSYQRNVVVAPEVDRRTKAGKEADAEFRAALADRPDAVIATADQDAKARAMREAVMAHQSARALLEDGQPETTLLFDLMGVNGKARPDWLPAEFPVIVDLKTAADASQAEFARASARYGYALQAAYYIDAAAQCGMPDMAFIHVVVETDAPYGVAVYQMDDEAIDHGRRCYERALTTYRTCRETGEWPGYAQEILPLSLPRWALS